MQTITLGTDPNRTRTVSRLALGAMLMGTKTDEDTSFAILDAYVEGGGTFIDTSNNYAFWMSGSQGGEREALLGRWLRNRGVGDEVTIATKVGARPLAPDSTLDDPLEGLSETVLREQVEQSLERLGRDHVDLYYAHIPDPEVPLEDLVGTFGGLVNEGLIGLVGLSNHWSWLVERYHWMAAERALADVDVLQHSHTYFRGRTDFGGLRSLDGPIGIAGGDLLAYLRDRRNLALVAYSPLLGGAYTRADKPLDEYRDHAGTSARRHVLDEVVRETGATANQVVLAWLMGGDLPVAPLVGASSVEQLRESLDATRLQLGADQRARLDAAH